MKSFLLLCLMITVLTSYAIAAGQPIGNGGSFSDPHTDCNVCHGIATPKGEAARFPSTVDPSSFCLSCHNYNLNHHPAGIAPARPLKEKFPLYRGKLTCLTCHEIHPAPGKTLSRRLMRGAPYRDRRDVCFECHTNEQYAGKNPHLMLDEDGVIRKEADRRVCLQCHEPEPDPSIDGANTVLFRADIGFLCLRCHPFMHSEAMNTHFQMVPSERILANIDRVGAEQKYTLPLVPRGRITCSTCHNPHQPGVLLPGPVAAGAGALHRLRDQQLCDGCHPK